MITYTQANQSFPNLEKNNLSEEKDIMQRQERKGIYTEQQTLSVRSKSSRSLSSIAWLRRLSRSSDPADDELSKFTIQQETNVEEFQKTLDFWKKVDRQASESKLLCIPQAFLMENGTQVENSRMRSKSLGVRKISAANEAIPDKLVLIQPEDSSSLQEYRLVYNHEITDKSEIICAIADRDSSDSKSSNWDNCKEKCQRRGIEISQESK